MAIESESVANGDIKKPGSPTQSQESPPHEQVTQPDQSSPPLNNQQNSILSLTLEEIRLKTENIFGSMNIEEMLASLWNDDENPQVPPQLDPAKPIDGGDGAVGSGQPVLAAGDVSFSVPAPLCKKTVDEVWYEIQKGLPPERRDNNFVLHEPPQRQNTFSKMTLEDFLVKAGVVPGSPPGSSQLNRAGAPIRINGARMDANYGMGDAIGSSQQKMPGPLPNNNANMDANYGMGHVIGSSQQQMLAPIQNNSANMNANYVMGQQMLAPIQNNNASMDANYGMGNVIGCSRQKMVAPMQSNNASMDANFGMGHVMGLGFQGQQMVGNNLASGNGYAPPGYPMFAHSKTTMGESSNGSRNRNATNNSSLEPAAVQNKKRIIDGPPEVVVERRQRRMIKNRESAARSRARKQAYTVELEFELNQLKEENEYLKQLLWETEQMLMEEVLTREESTSATNKVDKKKKKKKKKTLRRTVSSGW